MMTAAPGIADAMIFPGLTLLHPPNGSLVTAPLQVSLDVNFHGAPNEVPEAWTLCLQVDRGRERCNPLSSAVMPVLRFPPEEQAEDGTQQQELHTVSAWLHPLASSGNASCGAGVNSESFVSSTFATWTVSTSADGHRHSLAVRAFSTTIPRQLRFSDWMGFDEMELRAAAFTRRRLLLRRDDDNAPMEPYRGLHSVELPFQRSGDVAGRAFCNGSSSGRGGSSVGGGGSNGFARCVVTSLLEHMLDAMARRPMCLKDRKNRKHDEKNDDGDAALAGAASTSSSLAAVAARVLVLGSSSSWVFCDRRSFQVEVNDTTGGVWCRGVPHTAAEEAARHAAPTPTTTTTTSVDVLAVPGATALGLLGSSASKTGAATEFIARLQLPPVQTNAAAAATAGLQKRGEGSNFASTTKHLHHHPYYDVVVLAVGEVDRAATLWRRGARDANRQLAKLENDEDDDKEEEEEEEEDDDEGRNEDNNEKEEEGASSWPLRGSSLLAGQCAEAADRAVSFLRTHVSHVSVPVGRGAASLPPERVVVLGSPPPTMTRRRFLASRHPHLLAAEDEQAFERIAPSRREGGAKPNEPSSSWSEVASGKRFFFSLDNHSLFAESALSTRLNDALRLRAVREGFGYGDIGEDVTDGATGLLRDFFQPPQHDTHLHLERSLFFWRRAILDATKGLLEWC